MRLSRAKFTMSGVNEVRMNLRKHRGFGPGTFGRGYGRGVRKAARFLLKESNKVVPRDKGPLEESGYVEAEGRGFDTEVEVGYNKDGTAPYAIIQHENLEYNHAPGRIAKYLETTFRRFRMVLLGIIATETKRR